MKQIRGIDDHEGKPRDRGMSANADKGFMEDKMDPHNRREIFYPWGEDGIDYQEFIQLQTTKNSETEKRFRELEEKGIKLQQQLDSMSQSLEPKKMPLVVRDEDVADPSKDTQSVDGQGGAIQANRSLTGSTTK